MQTEDGRQWKHSGQKTLQVQYLREEYDGGECGKKEDRATTTTPELFKLIIFQVSNDILKLPNGVLEFEKPFKLFDMKKFQQNVNRELKRQYPERLKLETQVTL